MVFKSISTLMNKVTKLQDEIWKILAKQIFTTFAEPDRGFIQIFTPERGCITPEKFGHLQKTMQLKSSIKTVDSVGDNLKRASFTSSTKAWYLLVTLGAYTCITHNDRSNTLSFNIQTRDPKGIQFDTQSDYRGLVRTPTPAWADILWISTRIEEFPSAIQIHSSGATSFGWRNAENIEMIPLCFLNQF